MKIIIVKNKKNDLIIGHRIEVADTTPLLFKGLLGKETLNEGEGMLLCPCASIHCSGMKFAIDAIFLDAQKRVIGLYENLVPGSRAQVVGASCVLEMAAGVIKEKGIKQEDELEYMEDESSSILKTLI